ncbi:hypothetical protein C8J57DRAFT_1078365 [Mycena rebaudengoi]|nr:hypothetical protein C8J57DRAFT_1078365 [Mycena rebaudengoi]
MDLTGEDTINAANSLSTAGGGVKRTPESARRVNTAERRATHNAVERWRCETLNERFLGVVPTSLLRLGTRKIVTVMGMDESSSRRLISVTSTSVYRCYRPFQI